MGDSPHTLDSRNGGSGSDASPNRNTMLAMVAAWIAFAAWMAFWFLMSAMVMMASDGCHTDPCSDAVGRFTIAAAASQVVIAIATPVLAVRGSKSLKKRVSVLVMGFLAAPALWLAFSELSSNATVNQPL